MADRKALIFANRTREPSPTKIFRQGQIAPTIPGAVRPDVDAGKSSAELASFLEKLSPTLGTIMTQKREQEQASERAKGIASVKRASPELLDKYAKHIKAGTIPEKMSPFFREGVDIAYSDIMSSQYNESLFEAYERSGVKNDPSSGALEAFMQKFDAEFQDTHFGQINPEVLQDHFYPQAQAVRRQLSQRHTEYQNSVYRQQSMATLSQSFYEGLKYRLPALTDELRNVKMSDMAKERGLSITETVRAEVGLQTLKREALNSRIQFGASLIDKIKKNPNYTPTIEERSLLSSSKEGIALLNLLDEK